MKILFLKSLKKKDPLLIKPESISQLTKNNIDVYIETKYGLSFNILDKDYELSGAKIVNPKEILQKIDIVFVYDEISSSILKLLNTKTIIYSFISQINNSKMIYKISKRNLSLICASLINNSTFSTIEKMKGIFSYYLAGYFLSNLNPKAQGKIIGAFDENDTNVLIVGSSSAAISAANQFLQNGCYVKIYSHDLNLNKTEINSLKNKHTNNLTVVQYDFEKIYKDLPNIDVLILTADSAEKPSTSVLNEKMMSKMKIGSIVLDLCSEYGFGSSFQKKPSSFNKPNIYSEGITYFNVKDITRLYSKTASNIISNIVVQDLNILSKDKSNKNKQINSGYLIYEGKITNEVFAKAHEIKSTKIDKIN